jgi:hypothetical protein
VAQPLVEMRTLETVMASRSASPPLCLDLSDEEGRTIIHRSLDGHYRDLLDHPIPVLGYGFRAGPERSVSAIPAACADRPLLLQLRAPFRIAANRRSGPQAAMCDLETPEFACAKFALLLSGLGHFDLGVAPSQLVTVECWHDGARSRKCCLQSPATDRATVAPNRR